ncbi:hypothetical protein [Sorangium sp. So ce204]|uniref:hypothetical protein n=1 Tax=Sorangium sp. So ce204 TaxID=3133288 RepID=UPI003F63819F
MNGWIAADASMPQRSDRGLLCGPVATHWKRAWRKRVARRAHDGSMGVSSMEETGNIEKRALFVLPAAAIHLGLVIVLGVLQVRLPYEGWVERAVGYYGAFSGASSAYSFFAPTVGPLLWATFEVRDRAGALTTEVLETGASREADLRVKNIIGMFRDEQDPAVRRSLVASWAAKVFAKHPAADSVVVRLESYDLPSMAEYRAGKQPRWYVEYKAKFNLKARLAAGENDRETTP